MTFLCIITEFIFAFPRRPLSSSAPSPHTFLLPRGTAGQEGENVEEEEQKDVELSVGGNERRRRESVHQAWSALTNNLPDLTKTTLGAKR